MVNKILIIGPAWPLRGSLAAFDEKLAIEFSNLGMEVAIETFSLQYPSILFPGKTQYSDNPTPIFPNIHMGINSINPFNWIAIGNRIKKSVPDLIIVRYWIPFLAPCLGTILRIAKKNKKTKVIAIVDNMIPHEKRLGDALFTKYFANAIDGFVTMSDKVSQDVKIFSSKPILLSPHPIFEHFGTLLDQTVARNHLGLQPQDKIILFFGFIRKYKGLDLLLEAMASSQIKAKGIKLMIVGEFYESATPYLQLIEKLGIQHQVIMKTEFAPDEMVKYYLSAADFVIQPYRNATQSGVTPLAYHFEKPMLVTNVGALADTVPHLKVGVVVEPNPDEIANGIMLLYEKGNDYFKPYILQEKQKYTWSQMAQNFLTLYKSL
jgi:glycosyltransferase involved in cell wall biosynthesis